MKKALPRKLMLTRETIRGLQAEQLQLVNGAWTESCAISCTFETRYCETTKNSNCC